MAGHKSRALLGLAFAFYIAVLVQPLQKKVHDFLPTRFAWLGTAAALAVVLLLLAVITGTSWLVLKQASLEAPAPNDS